ncbi:MAG: cold shock domain-containing protein [candidate division Zixibacteria bacterium]|nr:cold shock domain-containing protein [candidate division Zixibacteria bacterium]MCK4605927.1 cold shock domain-containing protein [candidate division Zixibacteria bacterium]
MSTGKVKYFNDLKGWGFISGEDLDQDVYVHYTAINMNGYKTLREGQEVLYDVIRTDEGLRAHNVTPSP